MEKVNRIKVNTHHAYLNNDVVFSCKGLHVTIKDELDGKMYDVDEKLSVRLSSGYHRFVCDELNQVIDVTIEDAIKLGGSLIEKAFVFDDNDWVFVKAKDRLYATNNQTQEEKVIYDISPDEIINLCSNTHFLFKTKSDYSVYNIIEGKFIFKFHNYIWGNNHLVLYKNEGEIVVYDYKKDKIITSFDGPYSFGKKLYYVKNDYVCSLNLESNFTIRIKDIEHVNKDRIIMSGNYVLQYLGGKHNKIYNLFDMKSGEGHVYKIAFSTPYCIEDFMGENTLEFKQVKDKYIQFRKDNSQLCSDDNLEVTYTGLKIVDIEKDNGKFKLLGEIILHPNSRYNTPFVLSEYEDGKMRFSDIVIEKIQKENSEEHCKEVKLKFKQGRLLGQSYSGDKYVFLKDSTLWLSTPSSPTLVAESRILDSVFDKSSYFDAHFTSDGKKLVFERSDHTAGIVNFENLEEDEFDVSNYNIGKYSGINGYKPILIIADGRQPRWVDPITMNIIDNADISHHMFVSPDGEYSAKGGMKKIFHDILTDKDISNEEYSKLCKTYDWTSSAEKTEIEGKIKLREELYDKYGERLFLHVKEEANWLFSNLSSDDEKVLQYISREIKDYINKNKNFVELFIDPLYYVLYNKKDTGEEEKILIGRNVWYLNYVSFSYDSNYLVFGAKMKEDSFRRSQAGVFVLYNLKTKEIVKRIDEGSGLYAVWMAMFNKRGDAAFYDSHANAYLVTRNSDYKLIKEAGGKSLLCFSPSGKYIALSDQNYIDYTHHPREEWGHQPSGNVFIHSVDEFDKCICQYNDLGDSIEGVAYSAGCVASASFSFDEKRLMVVGKDGVIVVRNLHLNE